jgi:hypothetical protein
MSDEDLAVFRATAERLRREHTADPSKALAMLVEEGIVDENGELTEPYRS